MKILPPKNIIEKVREVNDPELGISVVDLGLIYNMVFDTDTNTLDIEMTLTTPACPLQDTIRYDIETSLADEENIDEANITFVTDPEWSLDMVEADAKKRMYGLD
ncbi:MAG: metal-sulfur cluster assembly factor [bacterium]